MAVSTNVNPNEIIVDTVTENFFGRRPNKSVLKILPP